MAINASADWDFRGADTRRFTHGIHAYPAMMIPQIAERLIAAYGKGAKVLFDPYCGTGSSLLEANIRGIDAIGADLNPLARLISRAKTTRLNCRQTELHIRQLGEQLFRARFESVAVPLPPIKNIDFWFSKKAQSDLAVARDLVNAIVDAKIRRFFLAAFSETARECSFTRNGEFKLYRMPEAQREKFSPDVFGLFMAKLERNFSGMRRYAAEVKKPGKTRVFDFDTVEGVPSRRLPSQSVDIVVTSPPYGDSRTTVAYGQFSRLANEWLEFEDPSSVDRKLMGGRARRNGSASLGCGKLEDAVGQIAKRHAARAKEICAFYEDYRLSIANVAAAVKPGGVACYVVGNRKSKGVMLPTDEATKAYFSENGFKTVGAFARNIPNKRMPAKNSPSNIPGENDHTMQREHIIVMRKRRAC